MSVLAEEPRFYTGIGSRRATDDVCEVMVGLADLLRRAGLRLRSGHAPGSDKAFEAGAAGCADIYLPWPGFEGPVVRGSRVIDTVCPAALLLAREYHPVFDRLGQGAQKLMARNAYQVLGKHLNRPSEFVVCWTPDGCESKETRTSRTGGTGLAIALASDRGIPVCNLANERSQEVLLTKFAGVSRLTFVRNDS